MGWKLSVYGAGLGVVAGVIATMISITLIPLLAIILIGIVVGLMLLFFGIIVAFLNLIGLHNLGTSLTGLMTFAVDLAAWMTVAGVGVFAFLFGAIANMVTGVTATILNLMDAGINFMMSMFGLVHQTGINPYTGLPITNGLPTNISFPAVDTYGLISTYQTFVNGVISSLRQLGLIQPCPAGQNCNA